MDECMTQVVLTGTGGPEVLAVRTAPVPVPGEGQLLLEMEAAGVAFHDIAARQGRNPGKPASVLGSDVVGRVLAVGAGVTELQVGQRVAALVGEGGYATHVLARADHAVAVPEGLDAPQVTTLVLNYLTAWQMLHRVAEVQPGQAVLVLGAAGGVGSALAELAALEGVRVYGTASAHRRDALAARGVTWVAGQEQVPEPVDATFDPVGGPSLARSKRATRRGGVVVAFGFSFTMGAGWSRAGGLLRTLRSLAVAKVTPGAQVALYRSFVAADADPAALRADLAHLVQLLADGRLHPLTTVAALADAAEAHRRLEARQVVGKLVLTPAGPGSTAGGLSSSAARPGSSSAAQGER